MTTRFTLPSLALAVAALLASTPALATIVIPLSLDEMARRADQVVQGRVVRQDMSWNAEKTRIYTVTHVQVSETLHGKVKSGETLQVRQIGGTVDGIRQMVPGNAKLAVDEEVILFLDSDEARPLHYVIGMAQGKFAVDRSGPEPKVVRALDGLSYAEVKDGALARLKAPKTQKSAPTLAEFKASIRQALR